MGTFQEHKSISVVIPTLDAAGELLGSLVAVAGSELVCEVIVSDGGSRDGTVAAAAAAGARIVTAQRGRGFQLIAGAAAASGRWLLFLHADCRLEPGWEAAAINFIGNPGAAGRAGYFGLILDDPDPAARRLERIVAWRCRVLGLPYGDQGLLISRKLYQEIGGFAPIPLMEDVDLVCRLRRHRLAPIGARVIASARRYRRDGYWRRPLRNLLCLSLYFAGVPPRHIARLYG
ncbi:MAG: TIGR04283 family arsenosugar biosynthesis glycosyltransferase [Alphaproteobacteria bacterium]|nr:TIGR04283 family arsenosugar biosynthesis glycosyltransferase [Alphaproteobacteria bacterium]